MGISRLRTSKRRQTINTRQRQIMSAKVETKIAVEWQESEQGRIPVNSKLSAESELYPFAFVSAEEYFTQREDN